MDATTQPSSLAKKLAAIVMETTAVQKRGHNDFHDYDYATAADVLDAVRTGLASRHIAIIPRITGTDVVVKERQGKSPEYITTVKQTLAILDGETGEVLEVPWAGCGQDPGDKGLYKALTGGYKYFLLQLFMIPTGDDPERDRPRKAGKQDAGERSLAGPASGDAAAVLMLAAELSELTKVPAAKLISEASSFPDKKDPGKTVPGFSDPREKKAADRPAWITRTKDSLSKRLAQVRQANAEPGVAEGAAALA